MGAVREAWIKWKMLRLPWRKQFLIGQDLHGNTFWEFKDALNHSRLRRIVKYRQHVYHSDVAISPQWHQWLRHTRLAPPTLQEQAADISRQTQLKYNAQLADERWASKAKYIEAPRRTEQESPAAARMVGELNQRNRREAEERGQRHVRRVVKSEKDEEGDKVRAGATSSPTPTPTATATAKGTAKNPGSEWQPEAWTPGRLRGKETT